MGNQDKLIFFGKYVEWHYSKGKTNVTKHKVTFEEASELFFFSETQFYLDESHSFNEPRYFAVAYTTKGKLLVACHTEKTRFHIISARKANLSERKDYEEKRNEFKSYDF